MARRVGCGKCDTGIVTGGKRHTMGNIREKSGGLLILLVLLSAPFLIGPLGCQPVGREGEGEGEVVVNIINVATILLPGDVPLEMVWIPPGEFVMGSPATETGRLADESQHRVTLTEGFWMGKYEVTNGQYRLYREGHSSGGFQGHSLDSDSQPVTNVSWSNAKGFCDWLSRRAGVTFRLPTEAEWEYACRAGATTSRYWGDREATMGRYANTYDQTGSQVFKSLGWGAADTVDGYGVSSPVGRFGANAWGLHDMIGNAWEWCSDWYGEDYYSRSPESDPQGPGSGTWRVLHGGSWAAAPGLCRSAYRLRIEPTHASTHSGFRVCLSSPSP